MKNGAEEYFLINKDKYNDLMEKYKPEYSNTEQNDLNDISKTPHLDIMSKNVLYKNKYSTDKNDPEHLNIAKNDLNDILTNPYLDISSRNALYDVALRNLIKKKRYIAEKPIKVEDRNLANVNANLNKNIQNLSNLLQKPSSPFVPKKAKKRFSDIVSEIPEKISTFNYDNDISPISESETNFKDDSDDSLSLQSTQKDDSNDSLSSLESGKDETQFTADDTILNPPETWNTPERPTNYSASMIEAQNVPLPINRNRMSKTHANERKTQALADYLLNKNDYGFTESGQLVSPKSKKIVKGSSHKDIADYHISMPGKNTPPGYKKIQRKLGEDVEAQEIRADPKGRFNINKW